MKSGLRRKEQDGVADGLSGRKEDGVRKRTNEHARAHTRGDVRIDTVTFESKKRT